MSEPKRELTDDELRQAAAEAEQRKNDKDLPLDVRAQSLKTYVLCLRALRNRGLIE